MTLVVVNIGWAQPRGVIKTEAVTGPMLTAMGLSTNSVSNGLDVVGNLTYVYLSAYNFGNADTIQTATFTLTSKPTGSSTTLTTFGSKWVYFKPDVKGTYTVNLHMVTATGSHDTTKTITASDWVGVGNFQGVAGNFPKCMTCHASNPAFTAIYNKWQNSGHANIFKEQLTTAASYSTSCMKCHTTGYNFNAAANNNGFDDIATTLGWTFSGVPSQAKWDSLKTYYPALVNHATIGCEMCHGAGSQHATTGNSAYIQKSASSGVCNACHDAPTHHTKTQEYNNSLHSKAVWSSSFAQGTASQNNSLQNCIRCHDGQGYINFTYGRTTNTTGMTIASHVEISCAACHDPHGNTNTASLRLTPTGSDTLANAYHYTRGGVGQTCMNCHKARANYANAGTMSSRWGPHHSPQADIFLGQNCVDFGTPFQSTSHSYAITNACVDCHMAPTDTNAVNISKVGGHSFRMSNPATGFDNTAACVNCHGPKNSFDDFMAVSDYDGNGQIQPIQLEVDGLLRKLRIALPPVGVDSIDWHLLSTENLKKAYWNYQMVANDGSRGMHNAKFTIDVLSKSILAAGGNVPVELVSFNALSNGSSVSLTWTTATESNNKGFTVERKINGAWSSVGFIPGKGTTTLSSNYSFLDNVKSYTGKAAYRLKQIDFDGSSHASKEVEVNINSTPTNYALNQNFPNPFNPSTVISFSLPYESKVKVTIYNIAGEVVKVLVNGQLTAGTHETKFDTKGKSISSGIYFYSIEANSVEGNKTFRETKKMMLLK